MQKGINLGVNLINDISGLSFDERSINILKTKQNTFCFTAFKRYTRHYAENPKYKMSFWIFMIFEDKLNFKKNGITHNNIILDPGIGFGKI